MIKLALCGSVGAGKTTISNAVCAIKAGKRLSFADSLRSELAQAISHVDSMRLVPYGGGFESDMRMHIYEAMTDVSTKEEYRSLLQAWGEYRRNQDVDYWVNAFSSRLDAINLLGNAGAVCVDDCRYPNEYSLLKRRGFVFVLLEDNENVRELTSTQQAHSSEEHFSDFEYDIMLPYQRGPIAQAHILLEQLSAA